VIPAGVSVTLVEPQGPVNVGHVARLVRNFGVRKLYLVKPKVDISVAAVYASHAADVLDDAVVTTFDTVREENDLLVATTAVKARKKSNVLRRTIKPEGLPSLLSSAKTSSLVFGRDSTGLTNEEIRKCDVTTTIESAPRYRALNVGNAVAIILYLASRRGVGKTNTQSRIAREVFAKSLLDLGEASRAPRHKTAQLYDVGKRIASSSKLTDNQLYLLSGFFTKAVATIGELQDSDSKT
jgi:tRNA/rRNA methyltransferase